MNLIIIITYIEINNSLAKLSNLLIIPNKLCTGIFSLKTLNMLSF